MIEKESWKDIVGYEGLYQVSNFGNIKSLKKIRRMGNGATRIYPEKILKPQDDTFGYLKVRLYNNEKIWKGHKVHRLVANAFIPNPQNKPQVNHKDGTKNNNHIDNLEWATNSENQIHSYGTGLGNPPHGERSYLSKLKEKDIFWIRENFSNKEKDLLVFAQKFNLHPDSIENIINKKTWRHI